MGARYGEYFVSSLFDLHPALVIVTLLYVISCYDRLYQGQMQDLL